MKILKHLWPLIFLLAFTGCGGSGGVKMFVVEQEGTVVYTGSLSEEKNLTFQGSAGEYIVEVKDGRVRMQLAHCPDLLCVHQGWSDQVYEPIICLPQKVVISITEKAQTGELNPFDRQEFLLDTPVSITVYAESQEVAEAALTAAFAVFERMNREATRYGYEGQAPGAVELVNAAAGQEAVQVPDDIADIIAAALLYNERSGGVFSPLVGPLIDLWGIGTENARVPAPEEIEAVLPLLDIAKLEFDAAAKTVFLTESGMSLDLGGIAKGHACDLAAVALREQGIAHALINAGGNVYALGTKPDGSPWRVGIRHPRSLENLIGYVDIADSTVVSSGDYERYFMVDEQRYHHIMDPRSGYPAAGWQQTTIISPSSQTADILSTVTFILGLEAVPLLLEEEVEAVFVDENGIISAFPRDSVFRLFTENN